MAHRLDHVKEMIARFDNSESNAPERSKPPVPPKPQKVRKSPGVVDVSTQRRSLNETECLPGNQSNDSVEVSSATISSKRKIEWPPKKSENDLEESQSTESDVEKNISTTEPDADKAVVLNSSNASGEQTNDRAVSTNSSPEQTNDGAVSTNSSPEQKNDGDVSNSSVEQTNDGDVSNLSIDRKNDGDASNSSFAIGESNSSNMNQSQFSDSSESSVCEDDVESNTSKASSLSSTSKPKCNYEQVAQEIYTTERSFVDDLDTLHDCYQTMVRINNERELDLGKRIEEVFSDFIPIYRLHSETFLPIMEKNYSEEKFWVGRVFNENNFILKTYKPFIMKQLDNEKTLLELLKNPVISEAVDEVLKSRKKMLGCANSYNVIFQRITRYSLLLKEYIKNLPDDCSDKGVAMVALSIINDAAFQLNETQRNVEDFNTQVLNALDRITRGRQLELQPWERFVKEGPVEKISARSITRVQPRYLFLFSGRLLVCDSSLTTYVIKAQMEVSTMEIEEINDPSKHPNSFRLRGKEKNFDLKFESEELENEWRDAITRVIAADRERRQSFMRVGWTQERKGSLGNQAPLWVKDQDCSMCMLCCVEFTFNNRRHHCRACGQCVCGQCSNYRHNLECVNGKSVRVCKKCKERLTKSDGVDDTDDQKSEVTTPKPTMESYISFADNTRQFKEKYAILSGEGFIELRARYKDRKAWKTIPIVGYKLNTVSDIELCFKLSHPSSEYYISCKTRENYDKWFEKIDELLAEFR